MKARLLLGIFTLALSPHLALSQTTVSKTVEKKGKKKTKTMTVPDWAAAHEYGGDQCVYFPDYYTFYDPSRGYVYWNNGAWTTTTVMPDYMSNVNMNQARMQILQDVGIRPETRYGTYSQSYPARRVEVTVPVPGAR